MSDIEVAFRSVSKTYNGRIALAEISFVVSAGEHTVILGPSGCGKSTVLRLLAGLEAPSTGQILFSGQVVSEPNKILRPPHLRGVAMVFQDLALWPNLSVMENVLLGLSGAGLTKKEARTRAHEMLALCAIQSLAERKPGTLSGGEQQRVALARAVAMQPAYLLLDEPFSGLDLVNKAALFKEMTSLAAERHITLIVVTHDPLEAIVLCSSALVLKDGRIEEAGPLDDLLRAPYSETLKVFRTSLSRAMFNS